MSFFQTLQRARALSFVGIVSPMILAIATYYVAAGRPEYSHIESALSELGAVGRPGAALMNWGGIIPAGLLTALAAFPLYRRFGAGKLSLAGAIALAAAGAGFVATALFAWSGAPSDLSSTNNEVHLAFALSGFLCLALAPLLFGLHARRNPDARGVALFSLSAAALVFVFGFVLPRPPYLGLFQRGALAVFFLWLIVTSAQSFLRR